MLLRLFLPNNSVIRRQPKPLTQRTIPSVRITYMLVSSYRSQSKFRNFNLIPIEYPSRVFLRTRLTLI
jgi:hypothetical protein